MRLWRGVPVFSSQRANLVKQIRTRTPQRAPSPFDRRSASSSRTVSAAAASDGLCGGMSFPRVALAKGPARFDEDVPGALDGVCVARLTRDIFVVVALIFFLLVTARFF